MASILLSSPSLASTSSIRDWLLCKHCGNLHHCSATCFGFTDNTSITMAVNNAIVYTISLKTRKAIDKTIISAVHSVQRYSFEHLYPKLYLGGSSFCVSFEGSDSNIYLPVSTASGRLAFSRNRRAKVISSWSSPVAPIRLAATGRCSCCPDTLESYVHVPTILRESVSVSM